jgi:hypothetical protein
VRRHRAVVGFEFAQSSKVGTLVGHHANVVVAILAERPATKLQCGPLSAEIHSNLKCWLPNIMFRVKVKYALMGLCLIGRPNVER